MRAAAPVRNTTQYGGSYRSAASFTSRSPRQPGNVNVNTALDLGTLPFGSYSQSGECGRTTGAATLFWKFRTTEPARLGLVLNAINKHTDDDLDIQLARLDGKEGHYSGQRWFYQRPPGSIQRGDNATLIDPGEFVISVSANSFQALPFSWTLEIRPAVDLRVGPNLQLLLKARMNQSLMAAGIQLPLEIYARLLTDHKLGAVVDGSYVLDGYWVDGYTAPPFENEGRTVGPRIQLVVQATLEIVTPTTL